MNHSIVTRAHPADAEQLTKISHAAKRHWRYPEEWIALWKEALTITPTYIRDNHVYKLLIDDNITAGFCSVEENTVYNEITHLWLLPLYIGQGFGKKLLQETLQRVAPRNVPFRVEADPYAEGFYHSQGFRTIDTVESIPVGRVLPVMERK